MLDTTLKEHPGRGRRRLRGGFSTWLVDHRAAEGWRYRRALQAGIELVGGLDGSELRRLEVERYAKAWVLYQQATAHWAALLHAARTLRGKKRPTVREVERAARRAGLADATLKDATSRLETLAAATKPEGTRDLSHLLAPSLART
jgi:hypothetical protein